MCFEGIIDIKYVFVVVLSLVLVKIVFVWNYDFRIRFIVCRVFNVVV